VADELPPLLASQFLASSIVLRTHQDKTYPGAMVASLSVPWGDTGDERGGYHLVWPRDLVETAGALLALGAEQEARDTLQYLIATQIEDGHWYQNQWLNGASYWRGVQLDETAFPVLLAAALTERNALRGIDPTDMVRRALGFIARTGSVSDQDRWEENAGVNSFTISACVAALVAGAGLLPSPASEWACELADFWNSNIERWTAVTATALSARIGVSGYYIRVAPAQALDDPGTLRHVVPIRNRVGDPGVPADELVGTEFLHLVRYGLRRADDALIVDSLKVIDALLKTDTPSGPVWHRYNEDGYGEQDDGRAYDGTGRGRGWPLLTGERGHYELAAGGDPLPYLEAMARMASPGGMLPEQVWDAAPIPDRGLFIGRPSGSAMPLVWAHAEFIKLALSRRLGQPVDRPAAVWQRYRGHRPSAGHAFWWPHAPIAFVPAEARLAIALPRPAVVHWGYQGWGRVADQPTYDSGLGFYIAELDLDLAEDAEQINFTWRWTDSDTWVGQDYLVSAEKAPPPRG
jgi:glucoamylase